VAAVSPAATQNLPLLYIFFLSFVFTIVIPQTILSKQDNITNLQYSPFPVPEYQVR